MRPKGRPHNKIRQNSLNKMRRIIHSVTIISTVCSSTFSKKNYKKTLLEISSAGGRSTRNTKKILGKYAKKPEYKDKIDGIARLYEIIFLTYGDVEQCDGSETGARVVTGKSQDCQTVGRS